MSKKIFTIIAVALLMTVSAMAAGSGTVTFSGGGTVAANVLEGSHSQQNLFVNGNQISGTYNWNTDTWPGRSTALVGNLTVNSVGDAQATFFNWVDFSQTSGSGTGLQQTNVWGSGISLVQTAGRHQGYAMTETINLAVAGPGSAGMYSLDNYMELQNSGGTTIALHSIGVNGTSGSASLVDVGWAHAAVRSGGLQFDSNGGWGPTGQPSVTATGAGNFYEQVYGSNYAHLGTLGGSYMTLPSGGTAYWGANFTSGFSFANMDAKANSGGI